MMASPQLCATWGLLSRQAIAAEATRRTARHYIKRLVAFGEQSSLRHTRGSTGYLIRNALQSAEQRPLHSHPALLRFLRRFGNAMASTRTFFALIIATAFAMAVFILGLYAVAQFLTTARVVHIAQAFVPLVFGGWSLCVLAKHWYCVFKRR